MVTVFWNVVPCSSVDGFLLRLSAVFVIFSFLYQVTYGTCFRSCIK